MTSKKRTIRVLSADAPKAGLRKNAEAFSGETGIAHEIELLTGPKIKERVLSGTADADLIVIPRPELDNLTAAGFLDPSDIAVIGHVTVGVTVRNGAREPDLSSVEGFRRSVIAADRLIYNTASSGQYIQQMFERLGVAGRGPEGGRSLVTASRDEVLGSPTTRTPRNRLRSCDGNPAA